MPPSPGEQAPTLNFFCSLEVVNCTLLLRTWGVFFFIIIIQY